MGEAEGAEDSEDAENAGGRGGIAGGAGGGGSSGKSIVVSGVWKPTVFRGRRRVPLLAFGVMPRESQIMLYTSMFSIFIRIIGIHKGRGTNGKDQHGCFPHVGMLGLVLRRWLSLGDVHDRSRVVRVDGIECLWL